MVQDEIGDFAVSRSGWLVPTNWHQAFWGRAGAFWEVTRRNEATVPAGLLMLGVLLS